MASGKKNYFRHSFFAHNDIKMKRFRDEVGIGFYFYYFSLLECLGTECEYESKDQFEVHFSTFRSLWGGNLKKINNILNKMNAVGLIFCENADNSFIISIPNFPKYLGKYTNKIDSNYPNKRKEKESKVKESKVKEKSITATPTKKNNLFEINNKFNLTDDDMESKYIIQRIRPTRQDELLEKWDVEYLKEQFLKAYGFYSEKLTPEKFSKKNWVSSMTAWIGRDPKSVERKYSEKEVLAMLDAL